jgi:hypothetical protein
MQLPARAQFPRSRGQVLTLASNSQPRKAVPEPGTPDGEHGTGFVNDGQANPSADQAAQRLVEHHQVAADTPDVTDLAALPSPSHTLVRWR